ncbi:MAG TPA: DNA polymerase Y family protein [Hyphomicrobiales bacterium]|nr:DNA polymerase Y family protein [Hyphomicrobiales bacterium]
MRRARLRRPPLAKPNEPFVLLEKNGNIRRIAALDEPAIRAGLHLHQPLADALAICPSLICADAEPVADREALQALAHWARYYSPCTAPAPPCGLWLDITGCAHLWSGEDKLAEDLLKKLKAQAFTAKAAIAPTFGAAYALAHYAAPYIIVPALSASAAIADAGSQRLAHKERLILRGEAIEQLSALLAPLPAERLRMSSETAGILRKLGLSTIGDVQKLPRTELARRFPDLLPQLDKAIGLAEEAIEFVRPVTPFINQLKFAEPISAPDDLERAAHKLIEMLCARLEARHKGGMRFKLSFFRADGEVQTQTVSVAMASRDPAKLFRLFREKLGCIDPGFGVDAAMIEALQVEPLEAQQKGFLRKNRQAGGIEKLAALIDALENRLGKGRVYKVQPVKSYIPERAVKRVAPLPSFEPSHRGRGSRPQKKEGARNGKLWERMGERPIRLFANPQPIDVTAMLPDAPPILFRWRKAVHRVIRADGPERIAPEWWRGKEEADENERVRDYYRVESSHGMRFWVFREGFYGANRSPRWFLHGIFP